MVKLGRRKARAEQDGEQGPEPSGEGSMEAGAKAEGKLGKKAPTDFAHYPHLVEMKPKEGYVFRSDYYEIDQSYVGCVLAIFHNDVANDNFGAFWGVRRIPKEMPKGVTVSLLDQVKRESEGWVERHMKSSDHLSRMGNNEIAGKKAATTQKRKTAKASQESESVIGEIQDGAAYLHVHMRLFVKAKNLEDLELAIKRISNQYIERMSTVSVAPYPGEQRRELSSLIGPIEKKRGKGYHLTSSEYAGAYSLVTNGLNDDDGEYIGFMLGDVNTSAMLVNVDRWKHHVVVADPAMHQGLDRQPVSGLWGSKISQAALKKGRRVVHIVLDETDLRKLGPAMDDITLRIDMRDGDVNMFELFGDEKDELNLFSAHIQKVGLMAVQAYGDLHPDTAAIVRSRLEEMLTEFYIGNRMWVHNAKENRSKLRLVGLPHHDVPRLQDFLPYLTQAHKAELNKGQVRDENRLQALDLLKSVFGSLLDNNGDLFNTHTSPMVDGVRDGRRVVYEFGELARRGDHVAMAQLVNVIGFAVSSLGEGDVVLLHGAEGIVDPEVKDFIARELFLASRKGARVAYLYNSIEKMLGDVDFNGLAKADYTIMGTMTEAELELYCQVLHTTIPMELAAETTRQEPGRTYIRRDLNNVVFSADLALGINPSAVQSVNPVPNRLKTRTGNKRRSSVLSSMLPGAGRGVTPSTTGSSVGVGGSTMGQVGPRIEDEVAAEQHRSWQPLDPVGPAKRKKVRRKKLVIEADGDQL